MSIDTSVTETKTETQYVIVGFKEIFQEDSQVLNAIEVTYETWQGESLEGMTTETITGKELQLSCVILMLASKYTSYLKTSHEAIELIGFPFVDTLSPALRNLKDYYLEHRSIYGDPDELSDILLGTSGGERGRGGDSLV